MKQSFTLYLVILMLTVVVNSCQKPVRDNPWDELSQLAPEHWAPKQLQVERLDLINNTLNWSFEDRNIQGFRVDRKVGDQAWQEAYANLPRASRSWHDSLISPDSSLNYQYRLYAYAGTNTSAADVISYKPVFEAPGNLVIEKLNDISFALSWQNNTQWSENPQLAQGFKIDRKTADGEWQLAIATLPHNQTSWIDTCVLANRALLAVQYRLYAFYGSTKSSSLHADITTSLSPPTQLSFQQNSLTSVTLNWQNNNQGAQGFILERSYDEQSWQQLQKNALTNYTDTDFELNQLVFYKLAAYYNDYISDYDTAGFDAQIPTIESINFITNDNTSVTLSWLYPYTGHEGFSIERKANEEAWQTIAPAIAPAQNNYTDDHLNLAQNYYAYRLSAFVGDKYSDYALISLSLPNITTLEPYNITAGTATSGGEITVNGSSEVSARGVVWSINPMPDLENNDGFTVDGSGSGTFTSQITGLSPVTSYYVRAYATNEAGTAYGSQLSFTTTAGNTPSVTTIAISNITASNATGGGNITAQGDTPVTQRGVCWSTTPNPTIANNITFDGSGTGTFTSQLTGLSPLTTYYVRAYAINTAGTSYGTQLNFTTLAGNPPTVTTTAITNITSTTATGGGNVTAQGDTPVTQRGVCWSTSPNPTTSDNITYDGSGTGAFTSQLTELSPATIYYVRAYAINTAGTSYGSQVSFTTTAGNPPTVVTEAITNITATTATGGGNVIAQGDTPVTQRGVCWSASPNPTTSDNITNDGNGTGAFTSQLTGLSPLTTYYVRAYAINTAGTSYGNQVNFTTEYADPCEGVTPPAGYGVVASSGKCWLDRNLGANRVAQYSADDQAYGDLYQWGRLTDGHEIRTSSTTSTLSNTDEPGHSNFIITVASPFDWRDPQNDNLWQGESGPNNPCPSGFRLPTQTEMEEERQSWISGDAAGAFASPLKYSVAGKRRADGLLIDVGTHGRYWTADLTGIYAKTFIFSSSGSGVSGNGRSDGASVRCIKD